MRARALDLVPRAGKQRVSRNAYRHGLSLSTYADKGTAKPIEDMARQLVGNVEDEICLQLARTVAEGQFALARVQHTKVGLIESIRALSPSTR